MKILVRATNWLGDAVMSLPALRVLKDRFPEAELTILARPSVAPLYEGERVIELAGRPGLRDFATRWTQAAELRRRHFDLAVILPNSFESAALIWLAGVKRRIGYNRDARAALLTDPIETPQPGKHERYYYLELLHRAGLIEAIPQINEIHLNNLPELRRRGQALFAKHDIPQPVLGVNPGAAYGTAKRWLPERFADAARTIANQHNLSIVVFGAPAERELCQSVANACNGHNLAGQTTLRDFIALTAACQLTLANDSGAMHIAAATATPCITVFGPTDEIATGPVGPAAKILREPVDCAPCKLRECPIDHRCMTRVTADQVVQLAAKIAL